MALIRSEEDLPTAATSEEEPPTPTPAAAEEEGRAGGDSEENDDVEDGNKSDSNNTTSTLTVRRSKRKKAAALKPTEVTEPYSTTARKRPLEAEKKNKKNKKKKLGGEEEGSGKKMKSVLDNQTKFNDADEIVVLNGILGYKNKGIAPSDINHEEFLTSIKESLHFDANVVELGNKMRRFKTKFSTIVKKYGEDPIFSKTHESERFNLMKLIWGEEVKNGNGNGNVNVNVNGNGNEVKIRMKSTTLSSNSLLNEGLSLLGVSKVKEMDIKRRKLEMEELECYVNRLDLEYEQTKAVLAALKAKRS